MWNVFRVLIGCWYTFFGEMPTQIFHLFFFIIDYKCSLYTLDQTLTRETIFQDLVLFCVEEVLKHKAFHFDGICFTSFWGWRPV